MKLVAKALIVLPLVVLLWCYAAEFIAVDSCLDAGNVYDYAQSLCRSDVEHLQSAPFSARLGWIFVISGVLVIAGAFWSWLLRKSS
jgi:hypothetical protein